MSDNSLDEGVALVLGKIILVAESENMTACELAWQNYDRLLCIQQTICQSASKRKRKRRAIRRRLAAVAGQSRASVTGLT